MNVTVTVSSIRCAVYCIRRDCRREYLEKILFVSIISLLVFMRWELQLYLFADSCTCRCVSYSTDMIARETLTGTVRSQDLKYCLYCISEQQQPDLSRAFQNRPLIFDEYLAPPDCKPPAFNYALCGFGCFRVRTAEMLLGQLSGRRLAAIIGHHRCIIFFFITFHIRYSRRR
jgi:hypothetical protein